MNMTNDCLFCRMVRGEEKCRVLYENESVLCILDIGQVLSHTGEVIPGRSLVIPKRHVDWFYELEDEEAGQLFIAAKNVANKIKRAFNPDFVTVFIRGLRVPHAHVILQPSIEKDPIDDMFRTIMDFFKIQTEDVLDSVAQKIKES